MFGSRKHQGVAFAAGSDGGHGADGAEDTRSHQAKEFCNTQHRVLTSSHSGIQSCLCCLCCRICREGQKCSFHHPKQLEQIQGTSPLGERSNNLEAKDPLILEGKAQKCRSKAPTVPREMQALTEGRASP